MCKDKRLILACIIGDFSLLRICITALGPVVIQYFMAASEGHNNSFTSWPGSNRGRGRGRDPLSTQGHPPKDMKTPSRPHPSQFPFFLNSLKLGTRPLENRHLRNILDRNCCTQEQKRTMQWLTRNKLPAGLGR